MKRNYQRDMEEEIRALNGRRPTLLLHSCCGPCSSAVIERLREHFQLTLYYYNPNIEPKEEYLHRLSEQERLLRLAGNIPLIPSAWENGAFRAFAEEMADEPEGGKRCRACFALRLQKTAETAKVHGFEYFATTLSVSPHKDAEVLNQLGAEIAEKVGVRFLTADFKKKDGYLRSLQLSKEYGLYRQNYCGCLYSREAN